MYLLSSQQIKDWDQFTIANEPVSSVDLMERAAGKCFQWIDSKNWKERPFSIFCGKGNNGGDGLVIARLLHQKNYQVSVHILEFGKPGSPDFQINLQRLHDMNFGDLHFIQSAEHFPPIETTGIVVDALFGSGLNQPLAGLPASLVRHINPSGAAIVSIDVPSGLSMDHSSKGNTIVTAQYTLSFQSLKPGLIVQENGPFVGEVHILDIGLHPAFLENTDLRQEMVDLKFAQNIYRPRNRFAHKGSFGHALLVAGSYGKMGAAVLAAQACIHSGVGLLTCNIPKTGYLVMQTAVPEAMVTTGEHAETISLLPDAVEKFTGIGIGPGIGTSPQALKVLSFIIRRYQKPMVIDADGLNCLSLQKELLHQLPPFSVLTPHPKEFDRIFGEQPNDFERIRVASQKSKELNCIIVLKGHYTLIATPAGRSYFNSSGNAGMAKGGSGDVLTGILTSLIAQNYQPLHAALLGVYIHGLAGDLCANMLGEDYMTPGDLIRQLSGAFRKMTGSLPQ